MIFHDELHTLDIAHLDCDAFFAAVEKRDNPELENRPVIIGGGRRGVVSTACYVARIHGIKSAMPMFKALKLCPDAVVIRPNMDKYATAGYAIRDMMRELTPLVQPVSIDEAFLDLSGTQRLHGCSPAEIMVQLSRRIKAEIGISVSVGLSHNKFLAKLSSDMNKPDGFTVIGKDETLARLAPLPVGRIWGVGQAMQRKLSRDGIAKISQLQKMEEDSLMARYGSMGQQLFRLSRGMDSRHVVATRETKSISTETTFDMDIADFDRLKATLWKLCEKLSSRCKEKNKGGQTVVLKLKTGNFKSMTRNFKLNTPTCLAEKIYQTGLGLLQQEFTDNPGTAYRLIGIGVSGLVEAEFADLPDLIINDRRTVETEHAIDAVRKKFGHDKIGKGRGFRKSAPKEANSEGK